MSIRLALAQINPALGDMSGNLDKILNTIAKARSSGANIIAFPELCVSGYPPEDLLLNHDFIDRQQASVHEIAKHVDSFLVVLGFAHRDSDKLYNGAAILNNGSIMAVYHKIFLPNYGVFDEKRYFESGERALLLDWKGVTIGVNICEDIWIPEGVTETQGFLGEAELVINISSSPYHLAKWIERRDMLAERAATISGFVAYVNLVGGQDELVFDGKSSIIGPTGEIAGEAEQFREDLLVVDIDPDRVREIRQESGYEKRRVAFSSSWPLQIVKVDLEPARGTQQVQSPLPTSPEPAEEIYRALVLGTHDYIGKNRFKEVVIGISGGIDSALVTALAVDALGKERVHGVMMPSPYTSTESLEDADKLADNLGIDLLTIPISDAFESLKQTLAPIFKNLEEGITEENLQARVRGNILMALSNKLGYLVLTTGNKSEVSVGYSTLYGDTAGGFALIKDLYKTMAYRVARWRNENAGFDIIPERILTKAPSAELKPDQTDQDTLPPYDVLDAILIAYIEQRKSGKKIVEMGYKHSLVERIIQLVDRSEYKRRQSPPGIKITPLAFGRDRRMPITNRFI